MRTAIIHTDGSCIGNPGPGGWAAIIEMDGKAVELSGHEEHTTNNRMEIMAAIAALEHMRALGPCVVTVHTDSKYLQGAMSEWIHRWKATGWKKGTVKNQDLWSRLHAAASPHAVTWLWVRGHDGNRLNERCDVLATRASRPHPPKFFTFQKPLIQPMLKACQCRLRTIPN